MELDSLVKSFREWHAVGCIRSIDEVGMIKKILLRWVMLIRLVICGWLISPLVGREFKD